MDTSRPYSVVVTGATSGLGFECARSVLARSPLAHVVVAARDPSKTAAAVADLSGEADGRIHSVPLNLGSLASVRASAAEIAERGAEEGWPPVRAVVCNAGTQSLTEVRTTADGFEQTFGVNHLGHYLFIRELMPRLPEVERVVVVASGTHDPDTLDGRTARAVRPDARVLADPEGTPDLSGFQRYSTSKLSNVLFAYELDRRARAADRPLIVAAFDPGAVPETGLIRSAPAALRWLFRSRALALALRALGSGVNTAEVSGGHMASLAVGEAVESGAYYQVRRGEMTTARSSEDSYDEGLAAKLWDDSAALVGVSPTLI